MPKREKFQNDWPNWGRRLLSGTVAAFLLTLAALAWLAGALDGGSESALAQPPIPVPVGDTDLEGRLFDPNPSVIAWTDGNVCAGNRPDPGCYSDGEEVLHRALIVDLEPSTSYVLEVEHDFEDVDDVVGYDNFNDFTAVSGATITSAPGFLGTFDSGGGRTEKRYEVVFTATGGTAEIRWDALLGPQAHTWEGATLHVRLTNGKETVPLPVKEIVFASIIINKTAVGGNDTFDYTTTGSGLSDFSLTTVSGSATTTFSGLTPGGAGGSRTVTESAPPAGWAFTSLSCSVTVAGDGTSTFSTSSTVATISNLGAGATVTCTYTNTKPGNGNGNGNGAQLGSITIIKNAVPNDLQDFDYDGTGTGVSADFDLDDDAGVAGADNTLLNSITFSGLLSGSRTIRENIPAGWTLTNISCSGAVSSTVTIDDVAGSNPDDSDFDSGDDRVTIDLATGEDVTCTFTNTFAPPPPPPPPPPQPGLGNITIVKDAVPNDLQDFAYTTTGTGLSDFSLDDDAAVTDGDATLSNSKTFSDLDPGSYSVTETPIPSGWNLTGIVCTGDLDSGSSINVATATVAIDLDADENIICTFTNTLVPPLVVAPAVLGVEVVKTVDGDDADSTFTDDEITSVGSTVTYKVVIDNDSTVAVTIVSLVDDVYGTITDCLDGNGANVVGQTLAADDGDGADSQNGGADEVTCTFQETAPSTDSTVVTDVITGTVESDGSQVSDQDDATIRTPPVLAEEVTPTPTPPVAPPVALPPGGGSPGLDDSSALVFTLLLSGAGLLALAWFVWALARRGEADSA